MENIDVYHITRPLDTFRSDAATECAVYRINRTSIEMALICFALTRTHIRRPLALMCYFDTSVGATFRTMLTIKCRKTRDACVCSFTARAVTLLASERKQCWRTENKHSQRTSHRIASFRIKCGIYFNRNMLTGCSTSPNDMRKKCAAIYRDQ